MKILMKKDRKNVLFLKKMRRKREERGKEEK